MKMLIIGCGEEDRTLDKAIVFVKDDDWSPTTRSEVLDRVRNDGDIPEPTILRTLDVPDDLDNDVYTEHPYIG